METEQLERSAVSEVQEARPEPTPEVENGSLKHLAFVKDAVANATSAADQAYAAVRPYAPPFVEPLLAKVEDTATAYGAPVVASASDVGGKLLAKADVQVDYVAQATSAMLTKGKESIDIGKERLLHTSLKDNVQQYLAYVHDVSVWIADAVSPSKNLAKAKDALHTAIETAQKAVDPDAAVAKVQEAWATFAAIPAVAALLARVDPIAQAGLASFLKAHDSLVASSYYKRAVDLGSATLGWAVTTTPYKLSTRYLYPWVEPLAAPTLEKLSNSQVVGSTLSYWKPVASI